VPGTYVVTVPSTRIIAAKLAKGSFFIGLSCPRPYRLGRGGGP
jgi:hypothetical protein